METEKRRVLRDGREFDHLFPRPGVIDTVIRKSADVEDTLKLIRSKLPETLWQTEKIARRLKGRTREETCSNIWHFVYEHIQYKKDEDGVEQVRSPRRAWNDRKSGVDCDCYSVFILSILNNLQIPCVARITKYPKLYPQVPRWQHVYPIVMKEGHEDDYKEDRNNYIVIDCVKDGFDEEEPYLECKDYAMRLDYLDGIDDEDRSASDNRKWNVNMKLTDYDNVDLSDISSVYDDEEEMNGLFKKIGNAVKKVGDKVGDAAKKVGDKVGDAAKKVGDKVGDGIRIINRFANPATILLRTGFLLAMKVNLFNVAGRLRYGYLSDVEANAKNMNLDELRKVRQVKDRAETVYWQAGGKKDNLKKAILKGRGNRDKKVPLSGLQGLPEVYADEQEYNIIHNIYNDNVDGLGELASGTAIAAATSAVAAIAAALKQVKGLFNKGGNEEQAFQSETDNAGNESSAPASISEDEEAFNYNEPDDQPDYEPVQRNVPQQRTSNETTENNRTPATTTQSALPATASHGATPSLPVATESTAASVARQSEEQGKTAAEQEGVVEKTTQWVKQNPGKSLLVAGGIVAGGLLIMKTMRGKPPSSGMNGLSSSGTKKKRGKKWRKSLTKKLSGRKKSKHHFGSTGKASIKPLHLL